MSSWVTIPTDEELSKMSHKEISKLANAIAEIGEKDDGNKKANRRNKEYAERGLEYLADALLRINRGWERDAYSEEPDTSRNRRIAGHEVQLDPVKHAQYISVPISETAVRRIIANAARAGLSRTQQLIYTLSETGQTQEEIAAQLGISQQAVCKHYSLALEDLKYSVTKQTAYIFYLESHHKPLPMFDGENDTKCAVVKWEALRTAIGKVEWYERS